VEEIIDTFKAPGVASAAVSYYRQNCLSFVGDALGNLLYGGKDYLDLTHPVRGLIAADTLLVTGRADGCIQTEIYDTETSNLFALGAASRVVRLSGGHFVHYESAADFNSLVLHFLAKKP